MTEERDAATEKVVTTDELTVAPPGKRPESYTQVVALPAPKPFPAVIEIPEGWEPFCVAAGKVYIRATFTRWVDANQEPQEPLS